MARCEPLRTDNETSADRRARRECKAAKNAPRVIQNPAAPAAAPTPANAGRTVQSPGAADGDGGAVSYQFDPSRGEVVGGGEAGAGEGRGAVRRGAAGGGGGTNIPRGVSETPAPTMIADPENPLWQIKFKHIATGEAVSFPGWVTQFSDQFQSQWNEEMAYGRMDPMSTFQHTRRNISVGLDIPAANKPQAINNTAKMDKLARFLYPVYHAGGEGSRSYQNTLKAAPLLEVSWANLIQDQGSKRGLVGYIRGINYEPDFDAGFFLDGAEMYPQLLRLNFDLTVLHTHLTGWTTQQSTKDITVKRQRSVVAEDGMSARQESFDHKIGSETITTVTFGDGTGGGVHTTSEVKGGTLSPAESAVNVSQMEVDNRNAQEERRRERLTLRPHPRTHNIRGTEQNRRRRREIARRRADRAIVANMGHGLF